MDAWQGLTGVGQVLAAVSAVALGTLFAYLVSTQIQLLIRLYEGRWPDRRPLRALAERGRRRQRKVLADLITRGQQHRALITLDPAGLPDRWGHWLLLHRQITAPGTETELAFYRCAGPTPTPVAELIRVAGAAGRSRRPSQTSKNDAGLDHYQVRHYHPWYRHITLAMLATAYLAVTRAEEAKKGGPTVDPGDDELIPLSAKRDPPPPRRHRPRPRALPRPHPELVSGDDDVSTRPAPATTAAGATDLCNCRCSTTRGSVPG